MSGAALQVVAEGRAAPARLKDAQILALFRAVSAGVVAAAAAALLLGLTLIDLGYLDWPRGLLWIAAICGCAAAHVRLRLDYERPTATARSARGWATRFTVICLAEGAFWGWMSIATIATVPFGIEMLIMIVTLAIAAGAVPTFGAYLPSFGCLFLPATVPFLVWNVTAGGTLHEATGLLMLVYILGMGSVGLVFNRNFTSLVLLRLEKEELAERLRQQKDLAEQANLEKSQLLASASHDLRQPVHALGLFVGALRGVGMPEEGQRIVDQLDDSLSGLDNLFQALLDLSRLDAGVTEVQRQVFAAQPLLGRIAQAHARVAAAKGLGIVLMPCSLCVDSDPVIVERIIRNLVENAIRYTDRGRVVIGCRRTGSAVRLQVWDSGRGIAEHETPQIFRDFYQIAQPGEASRGGVGLGLAIVRRLTEALGARLEVRSRLGRGSCFSLILPRASPPEPGRQPAATATPAVAVLRRGFIVVIDDDDAIRAAMASLLGHWGHRTVTSASGEGLAAALADCAERPDLIIADYRLGRGETGIAAIARLRLEYNADIPAILITGETGPEPLREAHRSGFLVLHKPVPNRQLRAAIGNLLRQESPPSGAA